MPQTTPSPGSLALTCACGAYLEFDARFAGQVVQCPECQRSLEVPALVRLRTSWWALASLLAALAGALTLVGSVAAVVLGVIGLRGIARKPAALAGRRLALAGIVLGIFFLGVGLLAYWAADDIGADSWLRKLAWAGRLEADPPRKVSNPEEEFFIRRPDGWGQYHPPDDDTSHNHDIVLVDPANDAYLVAFSIEWLHAEDDPSEQASKDLAKSDVVRMLTRSKNITPPSCTIRSSQKLGAQGAWDVAEMQVDMPVAGRGRRFLVRLLRRTGDSKSVVVAIGARASRFARLEAQFRKILDDPNLVEPPRD